MTESEENIKLLKNELLRINNMISDFHLLIKNEKEKFDENILEQTLGNIKLLESLMKYYPQNFDSYFDINKGGGNFSEFVNSFLIIKEKFDDLFIDIKFLNIAKFENILIRIFEIIDEIISLTSIPQNEINFISNKIKKTSNINNFDTKVRVKEKSIEELKFEIEELKKQIGDNTSDKLKKELDKKEEILKKELDEKKELEKKSKEFDIYLDEREKILSAIEKLKTPATVLINEKKHFMETRRFYNVFAGVMFCLSIIIFIGLLTKIYLDLSFLESYQKSNFSFYLFTVFPILFPTLVGFLFIRQSNINSKEIEKINKRFILIHEVNQSLQALVEINRGKIMDNKTEKIIDKLIENILNYASESNNINNNQETNLFGLNESIDKLIDTIDKKLTVIGKPE